MKISVCEEVGRWTTEEVVQPVSEWFTEAHERCSEARRWVTREVREPVERWRTRNERRCKRKKCKKWCLCCNKWFCWIATVLVKIVEFVIRVVGEWLVETICEIVLTIVEIIVETVVRVAKWVVEFTTCLFTDPGRAFSSFIDLWWIAIDVVSGVVDLIVEIIDDVIDLLEISEEFVQDLGDSFGILGQFFSFIYTWLSNVLQGLINVIKKVFEFFGNLAVGILSADLCQIGEAGGNLGEAFGHLIAVGGRSVGGGYLGAGRDIIEYESIQEIINIRLEEAFDNEDTLEEIRTYLQMNTLRFGLPITPELKRMYISSRDQNIDLRELHEEGILDLYAAAGYRTNCPKGPFNRPRMEVVYARTSVRVTSRDIGRYLDGGPESVPEFEVYAITKSAFESNYQIAQRKARRIGIKFADTRIGKYKANTIEEVTQPETNHRTIFENLGRTQQNPQLCNPPVVAVFGYGGDTLNGLASFSRSLSNIHPSGITFRDRVPEYAFAWVLIHELGHYFGLDHSGHDGAHLIMFTGAEEDNLDPVTGDTVPEYIVFTGEPRFSLEDARNVWSWITMMIRPCLFPPE